MKIFVLSPNIDVLFTPSLKKTLEGLGNISYIADIQPLSTFKDLMAESEEKILALDPDFTSWQMRREDIEKIPNIKVICLQNTLASWIDLRFAKSKGIIVTNVRDYASVAVGEWAIMMMLSLARKVPILIKDNFQKDFSNHKGIELKGKIAGVIGLGNIGKVIAENCKGLGMEVIYWSKNSRDKRFTYSKLSKVMKQADVIFPTLEQNDNTETMISQKLISNMKKTAIYVRIIRNTYNHELLLDMTRNNQIYGYGFEDDNARITDFDGNILVMPKLAWCTEESIQKNLNQWVESIVKAVQGHFPTRIV